MNGMIDREKVIEALHCRAYDDDFPCPICAYYRPDEKPVAKCDYRGLMDDAIFLLKEQEAVKPKKADNPEESEYCCGICGYPLWLDELYCAHCGRRIEWEGR